MDRVPRPLRWLALGALLGCSSAPDASGPAGVGDAAPASGPDASEDAGVVGHDASSPADAAPEAAVDAGLDPYFDQPCNPALPGGCGDNTECVAGYTNTGGQFDAGVEMHGHCSWRCDAQGDPNCTAPHPGGAAPAGSRCVYMNDGTGHVGGAVCAP